MNLKLVSFAVISSLLLFGACNKDKKKSDAQEQEKVKGPTVVLGDLTYSFDSKIVLLEYTSTGCPGCGSWGKPTFYSLADENKGNVIPMSAHIKYGDPMISGVSEFFANNRTGSKFTPQIWVNNESIMVMQGNSIDGAASIAKADDLIKNASPTLNVGLGGILIIENEKAYSKFGVKLNADFESGEYFVNSYLLQDGIVATQSSYANNPATHNYVILEAANGPWGNKVTKEANTPFETSWEHTFTDDISKGQYLVIILWKKVGNIYKVVSAQKVK